MSTERFRAEATWVTLENIRVARLRYPSLRIRARPAPGAYLMARIISGEAEFDDGRCVTRLNPGDAVLLKGSRTYRATHKAHFRPAELLAVQVPRQALPIRTAATLDTLVTASIAATDGISAVMWRYITDLVGQAGEYRPDEAAVLSRVTSDLFTAACTHWLRAQEQDSGPVLLRRIHDFIERRLPDPQLTPKAIAAAHQISLRQLHRLFRAHGVGVAAWIRQRRLERCRRDLSDPRFRSKPVHAVAARWGFTDGAHFSRIFRATYGMPPTSYRRLAQGT